MYFWCNFDESFLFALNIFFLPLLLICLSICVPLFSFSSLVVILVLVLVSFSAVWYSASGGVFYSACWWIFCVGGRARCRW